MENIMYKTNKILNIGDVHFYNFHMDTWNPDNFPITRFLSETGVESMPSVQTWQQITNLTEDLNYTSTLVEHREHQANGQKNIMFVLTIA
jgi:beta-mannosidase